VKNAARIEVETREPESKPEPDPLPVPGAEAARQAPATDTVPTAPTETSDDETEPDEEEDLPQTIDAQSVSSAREARAWTDAIARLSHNLRLYALRTSDPLGTVAPYRGDCQITSDRSQPAVVAKLNSTLGISERAKPNRLRARKLVDAGLYFLSLAAEIDGLPQEHSWQPRIGNREPNLVGLSACKSGNAERAGKSEALVDLWVDPELGALPQPKPGTLSANSLVRPMYGRLPEYVVVGR
jgi:hypothetical protein